jgi:hypothetical protein
MSTNKTKALTQPGPADSRTANVSTKSKVETVIGNVKLNSITFQGSERMVWLFDPDSNPDQTHIKFKYNIQSIINDKKSIVHIILYKINTVGCKKMFHHKITKSGNMNFENQINIETTANPVYALIMQWNLKGKDKVVANDLEFKLEDFGTVKSKSTFGASDSNKTILYLVIALIIAFFGYKMYKKKKYGFGKRR